MRDVRAHYIRSNDQARIPSRFVILDTEAARERDKKGEVQSWALAVATFLEWTKTGQIVQSTLRFDTPTELWQAISSFTRIGRRTVVYAHNLNYDLRISQALSILPSLMWTLRDMRLDGRGSWSKWSREKASLVLCDSASIFPVKLGILAPMFGMKKPPLPSVSERDALFARCEGDVAILSTAIEHYVTWLRTSQCGNWQMTGASQSWSHWRHSHYTHKILVHDNEDALAAERRAMYSGRCEAFRWGTQTKGPFWEYDWQNSYPRIARDCRIPTSFRGSVANITLSKALQLADRYAVLADVTIDTPIPVCPAIHDGRILWPTGVYDATLWHPELRDLAEAGAQVRVHKAYLYKKDYALKDWAEWILYALHSPDDSIEPWRKLILKRWSQALIGRFGMRYRAWESYATAPESRVYMSQLYNLDDGSIVELMQIGTDIFVSGEQTEIRDGCPQITSYIMSEARSRLWRAYRAIGSENVLYVDTDSLLVNVNGHNYIQAHSHEPLFDGLRSKARYNQVRIYGPRAYIAGDKPTMSGVPRDSVEIEPGEWKGEIWRGAQESVRRGEHDKVVIQARSFVPSFNQYRRFFNADGTTLPYRLPEYIPDGQTVARQTLKERRIANGYPPMLAHSAPRQNGNRPVKDRNTDQDTVRPMS